MAMCSTVFLFCLSSALFCGVRIFFFSWRTTNQFYIDSSCSKFSQIVEPLNRKSQTLFLSCGTQRLGPLLESTST